MTIWSWSTTAGSNATVDAAINWAEGMAANAVNNSGRAMMARLAELLDDLGGTVTVSGTNTLTCTTITAFTSLANGLLFAFRGANDNTGAVTLAPNSLASKKLLKITGNGEEDLAAGDIQAGGIYLVAYSTAADGGTGAWVMINVAPPALTTYAKTLLDDADAATARTTLGLAIGTNVQAYRAELDKIYVTGSNIASSSSIDIGAATGDFIGITGTTAITALGTATAGIERTLVFGGALTLTHNATSLILPAGGSNITTAAGDIATFRSLGSGNWRCIQYTKASGASVGSLGTMSEQNANNVTISGGSITGITDLAVADGGTGSSTAAGARTNLGLVIGTDVQAYDAELAAIAGLTSAADSAPYFTGSGTAALATLTSFGRSLIDDADAATARTTLGLVIGTNVQAYDAELAAIAGLTSAADRVPYFTGSGTAALATYTATARAIDAVNIAADQIIYGNGTGTVTTSSLTAFGRSLIDDADAATARTTLGLVIGTNVQAYDAELAAIAGLTSAADRVPYFTGSGAAAIATFTSFARTLVDDADAATARTTLGLRSNSEKYCFRAHKNGTNQTAIVTGTPTLITFGTENFDIGSYYNTGTSRWTPPSGKYVVSAYISQTTANMVDAARIGIYIYKNGAAYQFSPESASGNAITQGAGITAIIDANGTDYFEVYATFSGTGDKTVDGAAENTFFAGWEL
jgi:hypothetical protein